MLQVPRRCQFLLLPTASDYLKCFSYLPPPHFSLASVSKSEKWDHEGVCQSSEDGLSPLGRAGANQDIGFQKPEQCQAVMG